MLNSPHPVLTHTHKTLFVMGRFIPGQEPRLHKHDWGTRVENSYKKLWVHVNKMKKGYLNRMARKLLRNPQYTHLNFPLVKAMFDIMNNGGLLGSFDEAVLCELDELFPDFTNESEEVARVLKNLKHIEDKAKEMCIKAGIRRLSISLTREEQIECGIENVTENHTILFVEVDFDDSAETQALIAKDYLECGTDFNPYFTNAEVEIHGFGDVIDDNLTRTIFQGDNVRGGGLGPYGLVLNANVVMHYNGTADDGNAIVAAGERVTTGGNEPVDIQLLLPHELEDD